MDLATFLHWLDSRGCDLDTWPADVRARAEVLMTDAAIADSAAAKAAFLAMGDVERWLQVSAPRVDLRAPDVETLAAVAMRCPQDRSIWRHHSWRMARPAARATFAAAAVIVLCLGLTLGWGWGQQEDGPDRVVAIALDTSGAVDAD